MRYFSARVADNDDEDRRGRLSLVIPGLYSPDDVYPGWIRPRIVPGAGPGACGLFWIPPVDALVVVERDAAGELRWLGSELGQVQELPDILTTNYPRRVGLTTPDGAHGLVLDMDDGLLLELSDETTLAIKPDGSATVTVKGSLVKVLSWANASAELIHSGGVAVKAASASPTFPLVKASINTLWAAALNEIAVGLAAIPSASVATAALAAAVSAGTYNSVTLSSD